MTGISLVKARGEDATFVERASKGRSFFSRFKKELLSVVVDKTEVKDFMMCTNEWKQGTEDECLKDCLATKFNETFGCITPSIFYTNPMFARDQKFENCTYK